MPIRKLFLTACVTLGLAACHAPLSKPEATASPDSVATASVTAEPVPTDEALRADYQQRLAAGGQVYVMDPSRSQLLIYVFRGGRAAKAGHNHILSAPRFLAFAHMPNDEPSAARFDLSLPLDELVVDDPRLRAETGGNFAGERSESDISGTRRNMLGERGLQADQYPRIHLKSVAITGDWPILLAQVAVNMRGVTRVLPVLLQVRHSKTEISVTGSMIIRQTDFGIEPYSLFAGLLSVQDVVAMDFSLTGTAMEQ